MWIKQLIGRLEGQVVDLPFSAAENVIANGTGVLATDDEVVAAGFDLKPRIEAPPTDVLPLGYRVEPTEVGGFDLIDAAGLPVNVEPIPNMIAAVEAANAHVVATQLPLIVTPVPTEITPPPVVRVTSADYGFDPVEGGFNVFDPAGVQINELPLPNEDAVRSLILDHLAGATERTVAQVEADEAAAPPAPVIVVPENWQELHWSQRKALAIRISGGPVANAAAADHIIEEYVTRPR